MSINIEWVKSSDQTPEAGIKILVYVWRDNAVCQAWFTSETYAITSADEDGIIQVYEVKPDAISHWQAMPLPPVIDNDNVYSIH